MSKREPEYCTEGNHRLYHLMDQLCPCAQPCDCGEDDPNLLSYGPNPFAEEIHDDDTCYWMCKECRYQAAMDV